MVTPEFLAPFFLMLLIPALTALYVWRTENCTADILRLVSVVFIILALSQARIIWEQRGGTLVVVADKSKSMPPDSEGRIREIIGLLEKQKGAEDTLGVVSFSNQAQVEKPADKSDFESFRQYHQGTASNLSAAVRTALSIIEPGKNGRILLLTDGRSTGDSPIESAVVASGRSIPLDYRLIERPPWNDMAVVKVDVPPVVESGEAYQFSAEIMSPDERNVTYSLRRGDTELYSGTLKMKPGRRAIALMDRIEAAGDYTYTFSISSDSPDQMTENNIAGAAVSVKGTKNLLIVGQASSMIGALASSAKIRCTALPPEEVDWSLEGLSKYRAIVLDNVPASKLGFRGQDSLRHFVESYGGGLMMGGGRMSFGTGGYFSTPVAEILPVSMELRREHRKLMSAVVVALDRSGSMSICVDDGRQKMDLANQGTVSVLDLMVPGDRIGVIAVDSQAHIVVPMTEVGDGKADIAHKIKSIQSMGGGIFVFEALNHASQMLMNVSAGTRHIILFADAADSEEPGEYIALLKKLRELGITVSVIGLGTERDHDANLLKDIAARGGGNIYFTNSAVELPQLFSQEVLAVFKNAFLEQETPLLKCEDLPLICRVPKGEIPPVGGYNMSYLKPRASVGIMSDDSNKAPILSFWTASSGRVVAFTAEIDGKYTGKFGRWASAGELILSCIRWINQSDSASDDPEIFIRTTRGDTSGTVLLELDPDRAKDPFAATPQLICLDDRSDAINRKIIPFEWKDKDTLSASLDIPDSGTVRTAVLVKKESGDRTIRCSSFRLPYPAEFNVETDGARGRKNLMRMAEISGGVERLSLEHIFSSIPPKKKALPLWHILAFAALILMVAEIALRRLGTPSAVPAEKLVRSFGGRLAFLREILTFRTEGKPTVKNIARPAQNKPEKQETPSASASEPEVAPPPDSLSGALSKAKNKTRNRF